MQIELVLKGVQLGRYARERVEHKLSKVTEHFHREFPVRVVVEDHKGTFRARVTTALNHRDIIGQHESRSVLEALDEAIIKFDRQVLKVSDRSSRKAKSQRGVRGGEANGTEQDGPLADSTHLLPFQYVVGDASEVEELVAAAPR